MIQLLDDLEGQIGGAHRGRTTIARSRWSISSDLIVKAVDNGDDATTVRLIVNQDWEIPADADFPVRPSTTSTRYAITNESANFFAVEAEQSDWLIVNDSDSVASFDASLTESTLEGLRGQPRRVWAWASTR